MRNVVNINHLWAYTKRFDSIPAEFPRSWDLISLPHCWNAVDGQDGGNDYYRGLVCYVKEIEKSDLPQAECYYLEVQGANSEAEVFVNGQKLARHEGGYSTFRTDITAALKEGSNIIAITVDNAANETVYPQMADFTFYGGIYRDVNIICTSKSHFDLDYYGAPGIRITPSTDGNVEVEVYTTALNADEELVYTIRDKAGRCVAETRGTDKCVTLNVGEVHLWNGRKDPYLYSAEAKIVRGEEVLDNVSSRFGIRSFEIDPDRGFILNGKEYPLRGVSRHQDRWGKGNALSHEDHEEDMALIMELGATTIRLAHYQHDQYFYDLCDENGLVIWAEIPYISRHMPAARANTISQMKELVSQNYNHPSIVVWGLSNEITMGGAKDPDLMENHVILNDLVHEMDKTRLTTMAVVSMCGMDEQIVHLSDVVSYNHYFGWYGGSSDQNGPWFDEFHKKYPKRCVGISEYGCEALNWHNSNPQQGDYSEEYQAMYHEDLIRQISSRKYLWATHVWNMFDFGADSRAEGGENGQNHKGLVTFDRKYKKDSFYAYKAWLSDEPFVHLCGKRYIDRVEDVTKVTVYSNLPQVALYLNGDLLEQKSAEDHFFYFEVPNKGESRLKAVAGEYSDEGVIRKVETFNPDYRLREKGAILNWFDITEVEGHLSLNDRLDTIMATEEGRKLVSAFLASVSPSMKSADGGMMKMMGSFTVIRLVGLLGGTSGRKVTKEELLDLNAKLNQIAK